MKLKLIIFAFILFVKINCTSYNGASRIIPLKFRRQYHPRYQMGLHNTLYKMNVSPLDKTQYALEKLEERIGFEATTGRIVNGRDAKPGEIPYQLRIEIKYKPKRVRRCGAALVQAYGVQFGITAAHCLWTKNHANLSEITDIKIVKILGGVHDIKNLTTTVQTVKPSKLINHPLFKIDRIKGQPTDDLAVMFFKEPFVITETVSPIRLPKSNWDIPYRVTISGWGLISEKPKVRPDILQVLDAHTITHKQCKKFEHSGIKISEKQMCVFKKGAGACSGDSGGPAAARNYTTGRFYLAGVTTFGTGFCGSQEHPTLYCRISSYRNWIKAQVMNYKNSL